MLLKKIGLGNVWLQILLLSLICFTIYICYIPNFLYIKTVNVQGVNEQNKAILASSANNYFSKKSLLPKKNYIFFNEIAIINFLRNENPTLEIEFVKKKWPKSVIIGARHRNISYFALENNKVNIFSEDGMIVDSINLQPDTPASSTFEHLTELSGYDPKVAIGEYSVPPNFQNILKNVPTAITQGTGLGTKRLELNLEQEEYTAITTTGYKILSHTSLPMENLQAKLSLILADYSEAQEKGLAYIDIRFKDRAFICFQDQPCAKPNFFSNPESLTSSSSSNTLQ